MASFAAALKARDAVRVTIFHDAWANRLEQVTVDAIVVLPMSMQRVGTKLGGMVRVAFDLPSGMREEKDVPADNLLPAAKRRSNAARRVGTRSGHASIRIRVAIASLPRPSLFDLAASQQCATRSCILAACGVLVPR